MTDIFSFDPKVLIPKFHKGDIVYVVNDGFQYESYYDAYNYFGYGLPRLSLRDGDGPFEVIGVIKHGSISDTLIYAIKLKDANYINLIDGPGIALLTLINY